LPVAYRLDNRIVTVTIMGHGLPQEDWDLVIDPVVQAINTRVLRVHSFSPAQLLLGYNPWRTGGEVIPDTERAVAAISTSMSQGKDLWEKEEELAEGQLERLVRLDHIRMRSSHKDHRPSRKMGSYPKSCALHGTKGGRFGVVEEVYVGSAEGQQA